MVAAATSASRNARVIVMSEPVMDRQTVIGLAMDAAGLLAVFGVLLL
jgi:hypothetical protein